MFPYEFDAFQSSTNPAGLAWLLFAQSGEPGYYMLYNDLIGEPRPDIKKDRTLE